MKVVKCDQRSEAWFAARRGIPTCSSFDRILTPKKGEPSAAQDGFISELIAESIQPPEQAPLAMSTPEMEAGMRLEGRARCAYELEHANYPVREAGFILHDSGLFGGSPDATVGTDDGIVGGVEIKCPAPKTHVQYIRDGLLPDAYKNQVHGHMIVTGCAWWDFFSYAQGFPCFCVRVHRDAFTAKLEAELFAFCERYNKARALFDLPPIGTTKNTP